MESHIAIELLKALNDTEKKEFSDFIRSPFFNKSEVLVRLFEIIEKAEPEYSGLAVKKERLYKKLYPGKSYNEQSLRNRMAELSLLLKEFYTIKNFRQDEMLKKKSYIKSLRKKEKLSLAEKQIKETVKNLKEMDNYTEVYFRDMNDIYYETLKVNIAKDEKIEKLKISYENTENVLNYFILSFLAANNDIILNEIEQKVKPDFDFSKLFFETFDFEKYLQVLENRNYKHYPLLAIHYYANISTRNPEDEESYRKLKELIFNHYKDFDIMQIYNFWSLLSNSIFMLYQKKGTAEILKEGHEVNVFFIEKKLFPQDRYFPAGAYQNTVVNAVMAGELDWAESFAEEFKDKLSLESTNNRYNYSKAMISFNQKRYEDSIKHLSLITHDNWHYKCNARMFYLQNYYELGMPEQVITLIDSFRHFISNNTENIPGYLDEKIKVTLDYINKITGVKFGGKKLDYADYKKALELKTILHKDWLLEKMKELL